jgi:hypothetical protein
MNTEEKKGGKRGKTTKKMQLGSNPGSLGSRRNRVDESSLGAWESGLPVAPEEFSLGASLYEQGVARWR